MFIFEMFLGDGTDEYYSLGFFGGTDGISAKNILLLKSLILVLQL